MVVEVVKCHGDTYDLVEIIRDDENGYMNRQLFEFMYMSEILELEFEEFVDWSKVPVDTKILVSEDGKRWIRRHFAEYKNGRVFSFNGGFSSFTIKEANFYDDISSWKYNKLYEE